MGDMRPEALGLVYVLVMFTLWLIVLGLLGCNARRPAEKEGDAVPSSPDADDVPMDPHTQGATLPRGKWTICARCKGEGETRTPAGGAVGGSYPVRCIECGGDGITFAYERRSGDFTRPMGATRGSEDSRDSDRHPPRVL